MTTAHFLKAINLLTPQQYLLLKVIEENSLKDFPEELFSEDRVKLIALGYITAQDELTDKAILLIKEVEKEKKVDFEPIFIKIQEELRQKTGKPQKRVDGKYQFLPNFTDFNDKLSKICKKYKLKDLEKVESLLLSHVNRAIKNDFYRITLLGYYISKDGNSQLATDYFSFQEEPSTFQDITVNI